MKILGIETSCDETAAAIVEDGHLMLSNKIASSADLHTYYGGVVPEIAARSHIETIIPVIDKALTEAKANWNDIDAIAVTQGPGLVGSLLIGLLSAETLSIVKNKPLLTVNHVEAHVYSCFITNTNLPGYDLKSTPPQYPLLALIVSGNHTQVVLFTARFSYKVLGKTRDDAIGEAFDKVAKILGLPYPGGPSISKAATKGDPQAIKLPNINLQGPYEFSFSGLKTAVLRAAQQLAGKDFTYPSTELATILSEKQINDIAASFQQKSVDILLNALCTAEEKYKPKSIVIAGGVAANKKLRAQAEKILLSPLFYPDIKLCTDNAAMVASLAYLTRQKPTDVYSLDPEPSLRM
jgi:N6-L-threonylcarbamoyladenine synthase